TARQIPLRLGPDAGVVGVEASPPALRRIRASGVNQAAVERDQAAGGRFEIHSLGIIALLIDRRARRALVTAGDDPRAAVFASEIVQRVQRVDIYRDLR